MFVRFRGLRGYPAKKIEILFTFLSKDKIIKQLLKRKSIKMDNMSLYIPRVFANIMDKDIREVFERNYIGKIHHIDFVDKMGKDHKVYHSAYVHFEYWYDTIRARNIQHKLNQSEPLLLKVVQNPVAVSLKDTMEEELVAVSLKDTMEEELVAVSLKDTMPDTSINFDDLCADFSFYDLCVDFSREEINQIEINIFKEFELYIQVQ